MNWPHIARALFGMGYRGPVGLEAFAQNDPEAALVAFRRAFTL
jgi:hydroxypyruvate isomerase